MRGDKTAEVRLLTNHRHRALLRGHCAWPRSRRAEQRNDLAPFQLTELHPLPQAKVP